MAQTARGFPQTRRSRSPGRSQNPKIFVPANDNRPKAPTIPFPRRSPSSAPPVSTPATPRSTPKVPGSGAGLSKRGRDLLKNSRIGQFLRLKDALKTAYDLYKYFEDPGAVAQALRNKMPGWNLVSICPTGPIGGPMTSWQYATSNPCSLLPDGATFNFPVTNIATGVRVYGPSGRADQYKHSGMALFSRPNTSVGVSSPKTIPVVYEPMPGYIPAYDPNQIPIGQPVPTPRPLPYRVLPHRRENPFRAPSEQPQRGPAPVPRPRPQERPATRPRPVPRPQGNAFPGVRPAPNPAIELFPVVRPVKGGHTFQPPPPGTKERKFILALDNGSMLGIVVNAVGETNDVLEALHDALPKGCQTGTTPQAMAADILGCYQQMDLGKALYNLLANQLEDNVYGRLGRLAAAANRARGAPAGIQFGPAL